MILMIAWWDGGVDYKRVAWDLQDLDGMLTTDWECPTFCSPWSSRWWGCRWITVRFYRICMICHLGGAAPPHLDTLITDVLEPLFQHSFGKMLFRIYGFFNVYNCIRNTATFSFFFTCGAFCRGGCQVPLASWAAHISWVNSGNCPWERVTA